MARASYLWNRGSSFWFQMAIPKDLHDILGKTPIRIRLPTQVSVEATRAARILAGIGERSFGEMRGLKFIVPKSGFGSLVGIERNDFTDLRQKLENGFLSEIELLFKSGADALPDDGKILNVADILRKKIKILENNLIAMREKAREITNQYADYYEESQIRMMQYRQWSETDGMIIQDTHESLSHLEKKLQSTQNQVQEISTDRARLHEQIASEGDARQQVMETAITAMRESEYLKKINEDLINRLDYRGPLLSEAKDSFLADRKNRGISPKEIKQLDQKILNFIDIIGDKPIAAYSIGDIQRFARDLTFLPERHTIDPRWHNRTMKEIIEENERGRKPRIKYLCEKTILTGYVSRIKSAIRWLCADSKVDYPFENSGSISVIAHGVSVMRHGLPFEVIETLLKASSQAETAEELWMPLVGLLTGARLAELVFVQPSDIQRQNGTWIIDLTAQISTPGRTTRRALKTVNARRHIVLHEYLEKCGFVEWARRQRDWVFAGLHEAKSPANAASKRFQRKFREWGLAGDRTEVFHALRHTYKDWARSQKIEERTIALQTGHSLNGVALQYGTKALRSDEMRLLATLPMPLEWPLHYYDAVKSRLNRFDDKKRFDRFYKKQAQEKLENNFMKFEE